MFEFLDTSTATGRSRRALRGLALAAACLGGALLLERAAAAVFPCVLPEPAAAAGVRVAELPPHVVQALLAGEDRRFFDHGGVDFLALARACVQNAARGRVVSGASTVTMQLARLLEPRPRRLDAKVIEAFRARQLEQRLEKSAILEAYLARAPFGPGVIGIEAAARRYFGKSSRALAVHEAAALVALLPAPERRAPERAPELLRCCRDRVLGRMRDAGYLGANEWAAAVSAPLGIALAALAAPVTAPAGP